MATFEVGDKVKLEVDNLPYMGQIISYDEDTSLNDNEIYIVSVVGKGYTVSREASEMELLESSGEGGGGDSGTQEVLYAGEILSDKNDNYYIDYAPNVTFDTMANFFGIIVVDSTVLNYDGGLTYLYYSNEVFDDDLGDGLQFFTINNHLATVSIFSDGTVKVTLYYYTVLNAGTIYWDEDNENYFIEYSEGVDFRTAADYLGPVVVSQGPTTLYLQKNDYYDEELDSYGCLFSHIYYYNEIPYVGVFIVFEDGTIKYNYYPVGESGGSSSFTVTTSELWGNFNNTDTGIVLDNTTTYPILNEMLEAYQNGATEVKIPLGNPQPTSTSREDTGFQITGAPLEYYGSSQSFITISAVGATVVFGKPTTIPGENVDSFQVQSSVAMLSTIQEAPVIPTIWTFSYLGNFTNPQLIIYPALNATHPEE